MSALLTGFPPVAAAQAKVLILGSMPGDASLQQQQYYAHPRNTFWPMMQALLLFEQDSGYQQRIAALQRSGIALWDVIFSCRRQGSLDSAIKDEQPNDFDTFFRQHPELCLIAFNGAKAAQTFKRYVLKTQRLPAHIQFITLPSTSPAHAALNFQQKKQQWQQLLDYL